MQGGQARKQEDNGSTSTKSLARLASCPVLCSLMIRLLACFRMRRRTLGSKNQKSSSFNRTEVTVRTSRPLALVGSGVFGNLFSVQFK